MGTTGRYQLDMEIPNIQISAADRFSWWLLLMEKDPNIVKQVKQQYETILDIL